MTKQTKLATKFKKQHDELTANFLTGESGLTREQFDAQHAAIWAAYSQESGVPFASPLPGFQEQIDDIERRLLLLERQ